MAVSTTRPSYVNFPLEIQAYNLIMATDKGGAMKFLVVTAAFLLSSGLSPRAGQSSN
ncbi:MAG: hypothetical protein QOJ41_1836, partial [Acidobacteriaceae bacterium]|nr:hypothetical protein [Acidobacteriaceae bacterium]